MIEGPSPNRKTLEESLALSAEILRNIELSELPLTNIALKTSRLARLLNDFEVQQIMQFEVGGYPSAATGVPANVWHLAIAAGRKFERQNSKPEFPFWPSSD